MLREKKPNNIQLLKQKLLNERMRDHEEDFTEETTSLDMNSSSENLEEDISSFDVNTERFNTKPDLNDSLTSDLTAESSHEDSDVGQVKINLPLIVFIPILIKFIH